MPSFANLPVLAVNAAGVANDSAQGQVMTNNDTVTHNALLASATYHHTKKVGIAMIINDKVKPEAYFSASSAKRGFCDRARSSNLTICAKRV